MPKLYEQLNIFSIIGPKKEEKYCFDDDINEIHTKLIEISKKYNLSISNDSFEIWSHVPHFGYRMDLRIEVTKEILKNQQFQKDIDDIVDFAKQKDVELTPMNRGIFFSKGEGTATLVIYSTFLDKKRQKIK